MHQVLGQRQAALGGDLRGEGRHHLPGLGSTPGVICLESGKPLRLTCLSKKGAHFFPMATERLGGARCLDGIARHFMQGGPESQGGTRCSVSLSLSLSLSFFVFFSSLSLSRALLFCFLFFSLSLSLPTRFPQSGRGGLVVWKFILFP